MKHITFVAAASLMYAGFAHAGPNGDMRARMNEEGMSNTKSNIEYNSNTKLERDISPEDRRALSETGGRLLSHVIKARNLIHQNNKNEASINIDKALTLAQIIENNAPQYKVHTSIRSGSLNYTDDDTVHAAVVPIYSELERTDLITPLKAAKKENDQKSGGAVRVADSDFGVTSVNLDVGSSLPLLKDAQEAVNQNHLDKADKDLLSLEQNVSLTFTAVDLPLVKVRENLALARIYANEDKTDQAKDLIQSAARSLDQYAKNAGGDQQKDVESLKQDMEDAARGSRTGMSKELAQQISGWWDRITDIMES